MYNLINILSLTAIFAFIVSSLPQVWKLLKNKTARDISFLMALLITVGDILMLIRSVSIGDIFFTVNYSIQSGFWIVIVILILKYRGK